MKNFIKNNIKVVTAFIIGGAIFGGTTLVLAAVGANQVTYTNNGQSTVQGALDTLYTKANNALSIDADTFMTSTNIYSPMIASSKGICIRRDLGNNRKIECILIDNFNVERDHIQQIFYDVNCSKSNTSVTCNSQDYRCMIYDTGLVSCTDGNGSKGCTVGTQGAYIDCN